MERFSTFSEGHTSPIRCSVWGDYLISVVMFWLLSVVCNTGAEHPQRDEPVSVAPVYLIPTPEQLPPNVYEQLQQTSNDDARIYGKLQPASVPTDQSNDSITDDYLVPINTHP